MGRMIDSDSDDRTANNAVRHQYRTLSDSEKQQMVAIKDAGSALLNAIDAACTEAPEPREIAIARVRAEEAVMWAVKHVTK